MSERRKERNKLVDYVNGDNALRGAQIDLEEAQARGSTRVPRIERHMRLIECCNGCRFASFGRTEGGGTAIVCEIGKYFQIGEDCTCDFKEE